MNTNSDDYIQKYTMIVMAEEIQKLKEVLLNIEYGNVPAKPETWDEDELFDAEGRYLW